MTLPESPDEPDTEVEAPASAFGRDVLAGLVDRPRTLPAKYFYDERGSRLFDAITRLDALVIDGV